MTFRRVILPLALPAVVAGSIFTFSLTLGDYIAVASSRPRIFIGNVIYAERRRIGQPAAGGGLLARAAGDHPAVPASSPGDSARSRRSDGHRPADADPASRIATVVVLVFIYIPIALDLHLCVQRERASAWPPIGLHAPVGPARRSRTPASSRRS